MLPETLDRVARPGLRRDGWQDVLLVNSMDWPDTNASRPTLKLYHNNRNGTFTDVTKGRGAGCGDVWNGRRRWRLQQRRISGLFRHVRGAEPTVQNTGDGTFVDVTKRSGLVGHQGLSTSAVWFDYDRDGCLDLFVCNYVKWSAEHDVFCSLDGRE